MRVRTTWQGLVLPLVGGTMTGAIAMGANKITGLAAATANGDALRYQQLIALYLLLTGGTMSGAIAMGTNKITGMGDPGAAQDAATQAYVLAQKALCLLLAGGTMSGAIAMGANKITGVGTPTADADAATKKYIDDLAALKLALAGGTMSGALAMGAQKITGLGAATANGDALRYEQLVGVYAKTASGQYTGDNGVNRAIPHGLGVVPKLVLIERADEVRCFVIVCGEAMIVMIATVNYDVTAPTTTNFYVGNATSYANSANANAIVYDWVAIS